MQPDILRFKAFEPVLLLGRNRLKNLDIRIRVKGGGQVSQIYGACRHPCRGRAVRVAMHTSSWGPWVVEDCMLGCVSN